MNDLDEEPVENVGPAAVRSITLFIDDTEHMAISLMVREPDGSTRLMVFRNVSALKVLGGDGITLHGTRILHIRDIRSRGWFEKNWIVFDNENDLLHFVCETIESGV